jgi:hypothetical protein
MSNNQIELYNFFLLKLHIIKYLISMEKFYLSQNIKF